MKRKWLKKMKDVKKSKECFIRHERIFFVFLQSDGAKKLALDVLPRPRTVQASKNTSSSRYCRKYEVITPLLLSTR